jgi:hypothetical protein
VAFDTDAYITGLAVTHCLRPDPADTDRAQLTRRAVAAELADLKARANAMHQWSTAVLAEHNREVAQTLGREPRPAPKRPAPAATSRTPTSQRGNRRRAPRR